MRNRDYLPTSRPKRRPAEGVNGADSDAIERIVLSEELQAGLEALAFLERSSVLAGEPVEPMRMPEILVRGKSNDAIDARASIERHLESGGPKPAAFSL